ncbi:MAG: hypothetical protein WA130_21295 [Candidatus Methanoperedens sp.]
MTRYRLLDADFLVNLIRTLSLIKDYDPSTNNKIQQICDSCDSNHYQFISTNFVEKEVNEITKMHNPSSYELFFEPKKAEALRIKKEVFKTIRFIDMRKNPLMSIYKVTEPRNLGEISLVSLLSSNYSALINSSGDSVKIVSNNTKDVMSYLKEIKKINSRISQYDVSLMIMQNYEFYYDLFNHLGFDQSFRFYYYFVSNIDARVCNKNKIKQLLYNETGYS